MPRMTELRSPLQAQIVQWLVAPGDTVRAGDVLVILEAMKMEHELRATGDGRVTDVLFAVGETVQVNEILLISEQTMTIPQWDGAQKDQNLPLEAVSGPADAPAAPPAAPMPR